jgi:hypothetical protein
MTIQSVAGRLTTAILVHLMVFVGIFYLVQLTPAYLETFSSTLINEVALAVMLTAMVTFVVGVGVGTSEPFWRSAKFYKHLSAGALTANVVGGAHALTFGGLSALPELLSSATVYYLSPFGFALGLLTIISMCAYWYLAQSDEPMWESIVALIAIGVVATMLFSIAGAWAFAIVALVSIGFSAANRGSVDDALPVGVASFKHREAA